MKISRMLVYGALGIIGGLIAENSMLRIGQTAKKKTRKAAQKIKKAAHR